MRPADSGAVRATRRRQYNPAELRLAALCLAAPVGAVLLFSVLPVVMSVSYSVTDYQPIKGTMNWVGPENFLYLPQDSHFVRGAVNTVYYVAVSVPGTLLIGLLAALAFNRQLPFMGFFRVTYY